MFFIVLIIGIVLICYFLTKEVETKGMESLIKIIANVIFCIGIIGTVILSFNTEWENGPIGLIRVLSTFFGTIISWAIFQTLAEILARLKALQDKEAKTKKETE